MKKLILLLFVVSVSISAFAQKDTLTLYKPEIREMLQIVKQNTVYDTVNVQRKRKSIDNLQAALAKTAKTATVIIDREYVLDYLDRKSHDYMEFERKLEERNSFLRVANGLYKKSPKLGMLKEENLEDSGRHYQLSYLRMSIVRDLKYENEVKNTIDGKYLDEKKALIVTDN